MCVSPKSVNFNLLAVQCRYIQHHHADDDEEAEHCPDDADGLAMFFLKQHCSGIRKLGLTL